MYFNIANSLGYCVILCILSLERLTYRRGNRRPFVVAPWSSFDAKRPLARLARLLKKQVFIKAVRCF